MAIVQKNLIRSLLTDMAGVLDKFESVIIDYTLVSRDDIHLMLDVGLSE